MTKIKSILAFAALMLCGGAWADVQTEWETSATAKEIGNVLGGGTVYGDTPTIVFRGISWNAFKANPAVVGWMGGFDGDYMGLTDSNHPKRTAKTVYPAQQDIADAILVQFQVKESNTLYKWATVKFEAGVDNGESVIKATQLPNTSDHYYTGYNQSSATAFGSWSDKNANDTNFKGQNDLYVYPVTKLRYGTTLAPVASWKNFTSANPVSNGLTLDTGDATFEGGAAILPADASNGMFIDWLKHATKDHTVIIDADVTGLPDSQVSLIDSRINGASLTLDYNGGNLLQRWNHNGTDYGTDSNGCLKGRHRFAFAYAKDSSESDITYIDGIKAVAGNAYSSDYGASMICIGACNKNSYIAKGLKVYSIEIFDTKLTADQIAQYERPKSTGIININFAKSDAGSIASSSDTFATLADGSLIPGTAWNEWASNSVNNDNVTKAYLNGETKTISGMTISVTGKTPYRSGVTPFQGYMKGYIDDQSGTEVKVTLNGIPFSKYDLIVYRQGDTDAHKFTCQIVNDVNYSFNAKGEVVNSTDAWGKSNRKYCAYGVNAIRIPDLTASSAVIKSGMFSSANNLTCRGTIAAIQVVDKSETQTPIHWYKMNGNANSSGLAPITFDGHGIGGTGQSYTTGAKGDANTALSITSSADMYNSNVQYGTKDWTAIGEIKLDSNCLNNRPVIGYGRKDGNESNKKGVVIIATTSNEKPALKLRVWDTVNNKDVTSDAGSVIVDACTKFHSYAVVYDSSTYTYTLYVDGEEYTNVKMEQSCVASPKMQFASVYGGGFGDRSNIVVDDWRLYNYKLTTAELTSIANEFVVPIKNAYEMTAADCDKIAAADIQLGAIYELMPDDTETVYAEGATITGTPDGYYAWATGANAIHVVKKDSNSISINFGRRADNQGTIASTDANVGGYKMPGVFWNQSKIWNNNDNGTTEILKVKNGAGEELADMRVFYYTPNTYLVNADSGISGRDKQTTGNGKLTYSYFDDGARIASPTFPYEISQEGFETCSLVSTPTGKLNWEVGISNIPYQVFDLYIYQASDLTGDSISLLPIAVKANEGEWKYFAGDGSGSTIPATVDTRWNGAAYCDSETMTEGTNYIRYRISRAALGLDDEEEISMIYLSHPDQVKSGTKSGRLGLAGIQIVKVENDGYYKRKADSALSGDDAKEWTKELSWENSSHDAVNWPEERGTAYVHINGDDVASIKVNDVIYADMVTLKNTVAGEGETAKTFSFLTSEDLGTVDDVSVENPAYVLNAQVDATQFFGDLYLQSRITGQVALGSGANVVFIAPVETATEENPSKAYPYNFSGTVNAIRKEQGGVFEVPSSMYNRAFNVVEGSVLYNYSGDTVLSPTITGDGSIIKAGTGTMQLNGANHGGLKVKGGTVKIAQFNPFKSGATITVCLNGHLDINGKSAGTSFWGVTLDGGYLESNAASGLAAETWCNQTMPVTALTLNSDSYIGGTSRFGMIGNQWAATSIALGTHTLHKVGDNDFVLCTSTISGTGKIQVEAGSVSIRKDDKQSSAGEATIQVDSGAAFELYNNQAFAVKNICGAGAFNTHHASAQFIVSGAISGTPTIGRVKILNGACIDTTSGNATITELAFDNDSTIVIKGASAGSVVAAVAEVAGTLPAITLKNAQDEAIEGNFKLVRIGDNLVVVSTDQAAQTGDGEFHATIADAISALPEAGGTIAILKSIDEAVSISGTKAIKIENSQYLDWSNVTVASDFTGSVEFEFALQDSSKTDDENLRNKIKAAGTNQKFVFLGAGNNGVRLLFGSSCEVTLGTHLVFDGGTHEMSFGHSDGSNTSRDFGANATPENPTVLVKGNTTLNFTAKDLAGWNGDANADGIIRVNDTGVLNFIEDSSNNTLYLRQQLYLDPGSKMTFNYTSNKFRPFGGDQTVKAIYVPDQATDMTSKPAVIEKASGGNSHFTPSRSDSSVYVGANAKLIIKANIEQDGGRTFRKYGAGELEVQGNTSITNFRVYGGKTVFPPDRGNKGFQSSVEIGSDAELVFNSDDFVKYDGTYTYDIFGTFTLGARQTLGSNNNFKLKDGAVLNGVSTNGQGDFEFYRNATLSIADNANVTIKRLGVREENGTVYTLTLSGNNATVNLDESRFGNGIVKIPGGVTVKVANDKSVGKISGAGVVEYTQFPSTDTFTLQDDWTGAFSFTGAISAALNIDNYGNANSRVRLHGISGLWFNQQSSVDAIYTPALELKDLESEAQEATPAITINAFSATFPYRFGKLVGDGTFNAIKNDVDGSNVTSRNGALSFTDASEFSGTLKTVTGGMGFWIGTGNDNASHGTDMKAKVVVTESASVKSAATFVAPGGLYVSGSVDVATDPSTGTTVLSNTAQSGTAAVGSTATITVASAATDFAIAADGANLVAIAKPVNTDGDAEEIIPVAIPVNALKVVDPETQTVTWIEPNEIKPANQGGNGLKNWENIALGITPDAEGNLKKPTVFAEQTSSSSTFSLGDNLGTIAAPAWVNVVRKLYGGDTVGAMSEIALDAEGEAQADGNGFAIKLPAPTGDPDTDKKVKYYKIKYDFSAPQAQ